MLLSVCRGMVQRTRPGHIDRNTVGTGLTAPVLVRDVRGEDALCEPGLADYEHDQLTDHCVKPVQAQPWPYSVLVQTKQSVVSR